MTIEEMSKIAEEIGFEHYGELNISALVFKPEVREMCAADKCQHYNKSWSCPPGCGSLEEMRDKVKSYSGGILVQTTVELEDSFDFEMMMEGGKRQTERFNKMEELLSKTGGRFLFMGSGSACEKCETCTYPDAPCRFPDSIRASMSACGLVVSEVCRDSGVKYYYGPGTLTYTGCILF